MFYGFLFFFFFTKTEATRTTLGTVPLVRFRFCFFLRFVSSSGSAFNMCFNRHHWACAHTIRSDWGTHGHGWSERRVKSTNDKRINSRLICYLFRNCRFECNKIYAMSERGRVHTKDIQREERKKNAKQQRQQRRRHRVWSMTMGKYIYLFYCYYLYLLNAEATEAEERSHQGERDVWLLTNIYGPVFGHIQHNWLVTTHHSAYFFASKESIWTKCLESRARHTVIVCARRIDEAINSFLNALRAFWKWFSNCLTPSNCIESICYAYSLSRSD